MLATLFVLLVATRATAQSAGAERLDRGRFTIIAFPSDLPLARTLLDEAQRNDSFPGLPRPSELVLVAIAPDARRFREWTGAGAPDWGAAIAIPDEQRIVMQGSGAGSGAGDPRSVLRHELAHLALHEYLGALPPRWFDEGYAGYSAGEWSRDDVLSANVGLVLHGILARGWLSRRRVARVGGVRAGVSRGERHGGAGYTPRARALLRVLEAERIDGRCDA